MSPHWKQQDQAKTRQTSCWLPAHSPTLFTLLHGTQKATLPSDYQRSQIWNPRAMSKIVLRKAPSHTFKSQQQWFPSLTSHYQTHTVLKGCWQCSCTYIKTCGYVKGSHTETSVAAARLRWCRHILVVQPLPDDFVHAGVGEEGLIKLIVAPLPVAQQVHDHVPAELALVLHSQSCGTDNFLRIIPVHMDNCTSDDFTCPGIQNRTGITPNPFQRKQTHTYSAETTDNPCEVNIIKTNPKKMLFVMRTGVRRGVLPERKCN